MSEPKSRIAIALENAECYFYPFAYDPQYVIDNPEDEFWILTEWGNIGISRFDLAMDEFKEGRKILKDRLFAMLTDLDIPFTKDCHDGSLCVVKAKYIDEITRKSEAYNWKFQFIPIGP